MPVSDLLEIPVLTETMAQKTIGVNMAVQAIEKAISATLEISTSAATTSGFDVVIPFNTTNDLSAREALRAIHFKLLAGATANFDLIHPDNPHLFIVSNQTTRTVTVRHVTAGGTTVALGPGAVALLLSDGVNMTKMDFTLANITQAYDFDFAFYGQPAASQVMGRLLIARDVTFPGNLAGIRGQVDVNPLTSYSMGLWDDAVQIATITINTSGAFSATTTGGGASRFVTAGSILELRANATPDSLLDGILVAIPATTLVAQPVP